MIQGMNDIRKQWYKERNDIRKEWYKESIPNISTTGISLLKIKGILVKSEVNCSIVMIWYKMSLWWKKLKIEFIEFSLKIIEKCLKFLISKDLFLHRISYKIFSKLIHHCNIILFYRINKAIRNILINILG